MSDFLEKAAAVYEDIAAEQHIDVKDVIGVIRKLGKYRSEINHARRSDDSEREVIAAELPKLNAEALAKLNSKELHAELVSRGIPLRKNQGVLSVISKTRKQLLLSSQPSQTQQAA